MIIIFLFFFFPWRMWSSMWFSFANNLQFC
jgi:hypothetical protein